MAEKLIELWYFQNLTYFVTSWPSYLTYILVQRTCRNHGLVLACDQVWWWLIESFLRFCESSVQTDRQTYERAIGDCVLAKICQYNANCNGDSDKWNILDYIDVWLLWKSKGLHALADDANTLYPSTPIRPVLWPGDLVTGPLTLKINRALYSATMHLCMKFCEAVSKHSWLKRDNFI